MSWFFASGHAVDVVLGFMLIEGIWLVVRRWSPLTVFLTLAPGALMLIALRAALTGAPWYWIALPLTVSLPVHLADMRHRRQA
ncbi:hypothetical protein [Sphingomonas sp. SUN039]|uniref:hypothetical protein n=1 Tax=Sphingomonas sp. SUN039 TaxID=2937787 RepID=UPI0021640BAE|nr:hypothetical protein [Sphingomonas sp. SUN039]UVO54104.1 hypothetical protein M0209_08195 [Sphingomonas sp. SUN039]